jgi:hypothetical protein
MSNGTSAPRLPVSRDVVADLWPLYESGDASADTRRMVDQFFDADPEFARLLRADQRLEPAPVTMAPDAEMAALKRTRDLVRGTSWLRSLRLAGIVLTIFAFGRIIADTTWTASPRAFIADAVLATICWTAYFTLLQRYRRRALRA